MIWRMKRKIGKIRGNMKMEIKKDKRKMMKKKMKRGIKGKKKKMDGSVKKLNIG